MFSRITSDFRICAYIFQIELFMRASQTYAEQYRVATTANERECGRVISLSTAHFNYNWCFHHIRNTFIIHAHY